MNDSVFIDTNIVLYLLDVNSSTKKEIASSIIQSSPFISPQVIFECLNVCMKKLKMERALAIQFLNELTSACTLVPETDTTVTTALQIFQKYLLQPFDSKIVASAIEAGCSILYSEDMQHGLTVSGKVTIINPFL